MTDNLKFDKETKVLTVVQKEGVQYKIGSRVLDAGEHKLKDTTTVRAVPEPGYVFKKSAPTEWTFEVDSDEDKPEDTPPSDVPGGDPEQVNADPVDVVSPGNTPQNPGQGSGRGNPGSLPRP